MVRRVIAGAVLAGTAALAVAGCGSEEKKEPPEVAWAGKLCGISAQLPSMKVPELKAADALTSKKSLVQLMGDISKRMRTFESEMQKLGAPPVSGGEQLFKDAMTNLMQTRSTVSTASMRLEKTDVKNEKSLRKAVDQMGEAFGKFQTYQGPQQDFGKNAELKAAFAKAPACKTGAS
ncbi:hypothetical protein [Actinomadura algeriensis]|uniref:Uncharacterized protein with von Willebrand factor type A (VWA) domain n=1 Tax=Actinomadura algeriensis TaxID=1679523 RepID=A0ABR9JNV2_9ACTN|nr:hypothetical protein [Actinomadura algeriensis]MBE1531795.1 uncharacterized protein with von Willebrand factor type A (vWA) domain [Actinomadura algeriensis]